MNYLLWQQQMLYKPVSRALWERSERLGMQLGDKIRAANNSDDSIRDGYGSAIGVLGEIVFCNTFNWEHMNSTGKRFSPDYDARQRNLPTTADMKTKDKKTVQMPHYWCSVTDYNATQKCDWYVFCAAICNKGEEIPHHLCIFGKMRPEKFKQIAYYGVDGQNDPTDIKFPWKANCWNVPIFAIDPLPVPPNTPSSHIMQISTYRDDVKYGLEVLKEIEHKASQFKGS